MKRILLFIAVLFIAVSANAQLKGSSLTVNGGAKLTGDKLATDDFYTESEVDPLIANAKRGQLELDFSAVNGTNRIFPVGSYAWLSGNALMVDGTGYVLMFTVYKTITVPSISWIHATSQGVYTSDAYNGIVLFSVSGGTYTEITRTVDDGTIWKGTVNAISTKAFPTPVVLNAGTYMLAFIWNASATTTAPSLATLGATSSGFSFANSVKISATLAAQTTIPSSITASTLSGTTNIWAIMLNY